MAPTGTHPWRNGRQAFIAIHYRVEPSRRWDIKDLRQPYPEEIAVQVRSGGKLCKAMYYHRRITPVLPHLGVGDHGLCADGSVSPPGNIESASWEQIADDLEDLLGGVDMVITHGEGRVVDAMRQLNGMAMNNAMLRGERVCTDELCRLANIRGLAKDRWGYFFAPDVAEAVGVSLAAKDTGALRTVKLTRYLFDWAHKAMDGMHYETPVSAGDGAVTCGPFPVCLPKQPGFRLESYQGAPIEKSLAHAERGRGGVIVAPTGAGKSVMSAIRNVSLLQGGRGGRLLLITESPSVLGQLKETYETLYPDVKVTCCYSGERDMSGDVVLASRRQLGVMKDDIPPEGFAFLDIDEAHHAATREYTQIIARLKQRKKQLLVFGETATPHRPDGNSLKKVFGQVTAMIRLQEVRETGRIVNLRLLRDGHIAQEDIAACNRIQDSKTQPNPGDLSEILNTEENNDLLVRLYQQYASERLTVVYCVDIAHAEGVHQAYVEAGIEACVIHSRDGRSREQQDAVLEQFEAGHKRVMINVMSLTEGWDCPPASCAIIARPTNHVSTLQQIVGRVLRSAPGKDDALLIDVGVNQDALNQLLFRLCDESLELRGVTEESDKRKRGEPDAPGEAPYKLPEAWTPPLLPIGAGWLGVSLGGRFLACVARANGWLALEMRDPETHGRPQLEDIPDLYEVGAWLGGLWRRYRRGAQSQRAAWHFPAIHHRWWRRVFESGRHFAKGLERETIYEALDVVRQDPAYQREFGVRRVTFPDAGAMLSWVSGTWVEEADPHGTERETMVTDLRSPPVHGATEVVYHRYHERLLGAAEKVRGRLVRGAKGGGVVAWEEVAGAGTATNVDADGAQQDQAYGQSVS